MGMAVSVDSIGIATPAAWAGLMADELRVKVVVHPLPHN